MSWVLLDVLSASLCAQPGRAFFKLINSQVNHSTHSGITFLTAPPVYQPEISNDFSLSSKFYPEELQLD